MARLSTFGINYYKISSFGYSGLGCFPASSFTFASCEASHLPSRGLSVRAGAGSIHSFASTGPCQTRRLACNYSCKRLMALSFNNVVAANCSWLAPWACSVLSHFSPAASINWIAGTSDTRLTAWR